jgi:UDP-N-acetylglucosamine--N-acetylmuramyl-(pentapeptide) pyrophosphoryl-undecaprenol N-acetylglucosamine transferase
MKPYPKKILITGGHLTPAVAVIDEILRRNLLWEIVFVGRTHALEGSRERAREQDVIVKKKIRFVVLHTGRLQRAVTRETLSSLLKIPYGFIEAYGICLREKPDVIVSFGGYIALPVVVAASVLRIPVLTHEQTRVSGLANTIIARFARKICVSFPDIHHTFPKEKVVYTGLPIRKGIFSVPKKPPMTLHISEFPLLYITGGTTGSVTLNMLVFPLIPELVERYTVIHQTGKMSLRQAQEIKRSLPGGYRSRYIVQDYFDERVVGWILHSSRLVICRSGANTVTELALLGKQALLIPLPWSGGGEQLENARWLRDVGLGSIITQNAANPVRIMEELQSLLKQSAPYKANVSEIKKDGAGKVVDEIARFIV